MEDILELLQERNQKVPVPLDLPDYDDLVEIEEAILISLPDEYKQFMLEASNIVCGSIEPATCADPQSHTFLPDMAARAWDLGMPREYIPICEHENGFYCIADTGQIFLWLYDEGIEDEWGSIWDWAKDVWLES
ncbi:MULTISPECIES: SMI1/KNR4 family protein [unclassified Neptuniibacter]|uniref:SMI1/KNR4 family protein n=1 Tax=unclassified Neptuniibacter TaxID=2630693 RepID=UPI0026E2EAE4|nr:MULTISPECIES: SMI1/KNR4 family protein [unclassified Neptuniibacter]MDO6513166.1 SMI1/KNR4 family protein [Neptuniibacter sp. 2_MG-2023]MDO6592422.1 SMI1/KNR4 family protein [Neptuniibacter sp. 1_MG-2023]